MTQQNRAIVPKRQAPVLHRTSGSINNVSPKYPSIIVQHHYHGPQTQQRPSHYTPKPMSDSGLGEVAKWGLCSLTALLAVWILGTAISAWGNSVYWANERQRQNIWHHPAGGQW